MIIFDEHHYLKMISKILFILFIPIFIFPQKPGKGKHERSWAIIHPFAAIKVKKIYNQASLIYNNQVELKKQLDTFSIGGKLDAFRHIFFMAAFSQKVKVKKLQKLGYAHEKYNYNQFKKQHLTKTEIPDSISTVMDLKNNEIGFLIGIENKKLKLEDLKIKVMSEIKSGKAFILRRNTVGNYTDCAGNIIELNKLPASWGNKKCLISSSEN